MSEAFAPQDPDTRPGTRSDTGLPADILIRHLPRGVDGGLPVLGDAMGAASAVVLLTGENLPAPDLATLMAHHRTFGAAVTLAAMPVPVRFGRFFWVLTIAPDGRVRAIADHPALLAPMPLDASRALVMLGAAICDRRWIAQWDGTNRRWRAILDRAVATSVVRACAQAPRLPAGHGKAQAMARLSTMRGPACPLSELT